MSLAASTLPRMPTTTMVASSCASASSETPSDSCAATAVGTHPNAMAPKAAEHRIVDLIRIALSPLFLFRFVNSYNLSYTVRPQIASPLLSRCVRQRATPAYAVGDRTSVVEDRRVYGQ